MKVGTDEKHGVQILSLFDGMACGMIAMLNAGVEVESYDAYEIDKYAVQTAMHNFPIIEEHGDVFKADFAEYAGVDFLIGGSPCTYWSIAQTKNRETVASGIGWELFSQYVRALREAKPKYFIYENNKSMSKEIRASINETFGFEAVLINSALVSAQNRQRLYWVGRRNADGTYSKVEVEQPEDRGIFLRDILETGCPMRDKAHAVITVDGKSFALTAYYSTGQNAPHTLAKSLGSMAAEPVNTTDEGKSQTIKAQYHKNSIANFCGYDSTYGATGVAEPCCMRYERTDEAKRCRKAYEAHEVKHGYHELSELHPRIDGKINTLSTVLKDNPICEPVADICQVGSMPMPNGEPSTSAGFRVYSPDGKGRYLCANGGGAGAKTGLYALPVDEPMKVPEATKKGYAEIQNGECIDLTQPNSKTRRGRAMTDKSNCCMTSCQYYQYCAKLVYATPCEWDENGNPTKAVSCADGKTYTVYKVENGQITIKDKQYPIKLVGGFYIIRKLTVCECKRLQTVPEWYEFPVSDTQAYKMLGNGWTCDVITHLINSCTQLAVTKLRFGED